ncbi:MAG: lysophospholipid acyltransferase family protein [Dehalococcoidales bacterium]
MLYAIGRAIAGILLFLLTRRRVRGRDNVPRRGSLLVIANHLNLIDPSVLVTSLGRRAVFMAKDELFRSRIVAYLMRNFGVFPVTKGRLDRKGLGKAMQVLNDSQALVIFPEGMRSKSRRLKVAFPGAALLASRSGALVIPVGISGTEKITGLGWLWRRPQITVNIGPPFTLPPVNGKLTKSGLLRLTDVMMARIAALLPREYRGHYAAKETKWR